MFVCYFLQPRKRNQQKLSIAAQIRQTCDGCIDLETPNSILVNTDLRVCMLPATTACGWLVGLYIVDARGVAHYIVV